MKINIEVIDIKITKKGTTVTVKLVVPSESKESK